MLPGRAARQPGIGKGSSAFKKGREEETAEAAWAAGFFYPGLLYVCLCRPSDRALWAGAVGAASVPALVFWQGSTQQPSAIVQGSLLVNSTGWAAAVERHAWPAVPQLTPASASRQLSACSLSTRAAESLPGALCVLLLGRGTQLADARASLEALHSELSSGGSGAKAEQRAAASLLAQGKLQLAWADSGRQRALCRHLMLWSGTSMQQGASLCEPWWRRQVGALLGQQRQQLQPALVAYRQTQPGSRDRQLPVASYPGSLEDREALAAWLAALGDVSRQGHLLRPAPLLDVQLAASADMWPALAALLLRALHLASRAELLWQRAASVVGAAAGRVDWRRVAQAALAAGALLGVKWVLDTLGGTEGEGPACWMCPPPHAAGSCGLECRITGPCTLRSRLVCPLLGNANPPNCTILPPMMQTSWLGTSSPARRERAGSAVTAAPCPAAMPFSPCQRCGHQIGSPAPAASSSCCRCTLLAGGQLHSSGSMHSSSLLRWQRCSAASGAWSSGSRLSPAPWPLCWLERAASVGTAGQAAKGCSSVHGRRDSRVTTCSRRRRRSYCTLREAAVSSCCSWQVCTKRR